MAGGSSLRAGLLFRPVRVLKGTTAISVGARQTGMRVRAWKSGKMR